jgi:multicomponent Na+:H+ antiporter subunit C
MNLVFAIAAACLFGTGAYLIMSRDLVRVVIGVVVISQAAVLTLIASSVVRGRAPIYPLPDEAVADPLSQAMALTAIVIGMAVVALILALVFRLSRALESREIDELAEIEAERDVRLERRHAQLQETEEDAAR